MKISNINSGMQPSYLLALFFFFSLILGTSLLFSPKNKDLEDFFLASRKLPFFLVFLTVAASWMGAASTLVSTDEALRQGLSSFWVMGLPTVVTVLLFAFVLARPIRSLPILSLPDLVEMRYGRKVRHLSSVLIVWYMILLAASQMVALGQFLKYFLGMSYVESLMLGTLVVVSYAVLGGFKSVVITDSVQFFFLAAGILALFFTLLKSGGGQGMGAALSEWGKPFYFEPFFDIKRNFLIFLSFTLAWVISPITWQRIQGARDHKSAKRGLLLAAAVLLVMYIMLLLIGMMSLPSPHSQFNGIPLLSRIISAQGGSFLGILLFIAIISAVMSTLDTAINTGALSLSHDVLAQIPFFHGKQHPVWMARSATLLIGTISFLIAIRFQSILKTLGLASEIMAEGLFIPGIAMLFLKRKFPSAGFLSLVSGGGFAVIGFFHEIGVLGWSWPSWPFSIPWGVALSGLGFGLGVVIDLRNRIS